MVAGITDGKPSESGRVLLTSERITECVHTSPCVMDVVILVTMTAPAAAAAMSHG